MIGPFRCKLFWYSKQFHMNNKKRVGRTQTKEVTPQTLGREMSLTMGFLCARQSATIYHQTLHLLSTQCFVMPDASHEPLTGGVTQQASGVLWVGANMMPLLWAAVNGMPLLWAAVNVKPLLWPWAILMPLLRAAVNTMMLLWAAVHVMPLLWAKANMMPPYGQQSNVMPLLWAAVNVMPLHKACRRDSC